jgi:hypothetical protein
VGGLSLLRRGAVGFRVAEVVGRREVELGLLRSGSRRGRMARHTPGMVGGSGSLSRRRLLVFCQAAGLGAVCSTVRLLVTGQAELESPIGRHVVYCRLCRGKDWVVAAAVCSDDDCCWRLMAESRIECRDRDRPLF